jgi:cyclase
VIVEVNDGVFGYVQEPGGWCVSNSGLVGGPDGMLVIDTLATESRAGRLREAVDRLATGPGRTLVNTHSHGDHTFGNHHYGPGVTIVAHAGARSEMAETGTALTALWPEVDWGDVRVTLPTVTFEDRLTLYLGERRVELISVAPAHTGHDVVVWLPAERALFAGDVVMSEATPFCLFGSVSGMLAAIERLRALEPATVVCGHGPIAGPEVFDVNAAYLRWIQELAAEGKAAGLTPLEAATKADLGAYADLLDAERLVGNLHRAYTDTPERLDPTEIFNEMVAYNGGRLPTCLA